MTSLSPTPDRLPLAQMRLLWEWCQVTKVEYATVGASLHVKDIAFMHVKALEQKVQAGTYIGNYEGATGTVWQDAMSIVASAHPKAAKNP
ncbi:hypothetical protein V1504DRAFT_453712 [Lipomyces starkeyi]